MRNIYVKGMFGIKCCLSAAAAVTVTVLGSSVTEAANIPSCNPEHVSISVEGSSAKTYNMTLKTNNSLVKWDSFSLGINDVMHVSSEVSGKSSVLNLVKSGITDIKGSILAKNDGINFYLVNPNGIRLAPGSHIDGFNSLYLGTSALTGKDGANLVRVFAEGSSAEAVNIDQMPDKDGMGRVKMLGRIDTDNLFVNGSSITLLDVDTLKDQDNSLPNRLQLTSSTGRIDISSNDDASQTYSFAGREGSARNFLEYNGLKPADKEELKYNGYHSAGFYVEHNGEQAVYTPEQLLNIQAEGKYWLADDIDVVALNNGGIDNIPVFRGSLDGAFNSVSFGGTFDGSTTDAGLFGRLEGAEISNLLINQADIKLTGKDPSKAVNAGGLAGTLAAGTSLNRVTVNRFSLSKNNMDLSNVVAGGLAGKTEGNVFLTDVTVRNSDLRMLKRYDNFDAENFGLLVGRSDDADNIKASGIVFADGQGLDRVFGNTDSVVGVFASAGEAFKAAAVGSGLQDRFLIDRNEQGEVSDLNLKGFYCPFFVKDLTVEYDGNEHNYRDVYEENDFSVFNGIDDNGFVNVGDDVSLVQKNAGEYVYILDPVQLSFGHGFYTDTRYTAGGDHERESSLHGYGVMTVKKKQIAVALKDQTVYEDESADLTVSDATIKDYDSLLSQLGNGDDISDLKLTLQESGNFLTASAGEGNYEISISNGKLIRQERPVIPTPEPEPEPLPVVPEIPAFPSAPSRPVTVMPEPALPETAYRLPDEDLDRFYESEESEQFDYGFLYLNKAVPADVSSRDHGVRLLADIGAYESALPEVAGHSILSSISSENGADQKETSYRSNYAEPKAVKGLEDLSGGSKNTAEASAKPVNKVGEEDQKLRISKTDPLPAKEQRDAKSSVYLSSTY